jgi:hypothetical protein
MQRTRLARWLVVGALAGLGLVFGSGFASAQEEEETTVQGSNTSTESTAASSDASASNQAEVSAGPSSSNGGSSQQVGNNSTTVNQNAQAKSGDAVAGSQVTGVVGGGATVQNTNNSSGATAVSGEATASNAAVVNAGPQAGNGGTAQQVGNNNVEVNQSSSATSGTAAAGTQVTGVVGSGATVRARPCFELPRVAGQRPRMGKRWASSSRDQQQMAGPAYLRAVKTIVSRIRRKGAVSMLQAIVSNPRLR